MFVIYLVLYILKILFLNKKINNRVYSEVEGGLSIFWGKREMMNLNRSTRNHPKDILHYSQNLEIIPQEKGGQTKDELCNSRN